MSGVPSPHSVQDAASKLTAWLEYERTPFEERPTEHEFGWQYDPRNDVQSLLEQLEATDKLLREMQRPLAVALAIRKVMREHRKGKPIAFQMWRPWR